MSDERAREEAFQKWWASPDAVGDDARHLAMKAWEASEANAVRTIAGEWGEFEVGPCETISKAVEIIRDTGRVLLRHVYQDQDWITWANSKLRGTSYSPVKLRMAIDNLMAGDDSEASLSSPED